MSPQVVSRVLYGKSQVSDQTLPRFQHATLHGYSRSKINNVAYPAVIKDSKSSVKGMLVTGISDAELAKLDEFEGDEYERRAVEVITDEGKKRLHTNCYIWIDDIDRLTGTDWNFDEFMGNKFNTWIETESI
ncbi:hypothetical protein V1514DRAFT_330999 [Lipomyces japonicus]|uniref:uncharacterized protein n=1 Tax=Lipomyces japonicus TaxID=56871 RepID=UPI0034CFC48D